MIALLTTLCVIFLAADVFFGLLCWHLLGELQKAELEYSKLRRKFFEITKLIEEVLKYEQP